VQRRRLLAAIVVLVLVAIGLVVGIATRGGGSPGDAAALSRWYTQYGKSENASVEQLYSSLLKELNHSKIDDGGPGIANVKSTCQSGAALLKAVSKDPLPPAGALRNTVETMRQTGTLVYADCVQGIDEPVIAQSKQLVTDMASEMSKYSPLFSTFAHDVATSGLGT
jgi:hypothetical protein